MQTLPDFVPIVFDILDLWVSFSSETVTINDASQIYICGFQIYIYLEYYGGS